MKNISERFKILLLSDVCWVSEFYKAQLSSEGYVVFVNMDPLSLLEATIAFHPNVVLISNGSCQRRKIKMAIQTLRDRHPRLPIILLITGEDDAPYDLLSGVEACFFKSVRSFDRLLEKIAELCSPARMVGS